MAGWAVYTMSHRERDGRSAHIQIPIACQHALSKHKNLFVTNYQATICLLMLVNSSSCLTLVLTSCAGTLCLCVTLVFVCNTCVCLFRVCLSLDVNACCSSSVLVVWHFYTQVVLAVSKTVVASQSEEPSGSWETPWHVRVGQRQRWKSELGIDAHILWFGR